MAVLRNLALLGTILLVAGCVTTPATPEELAYCQRMASSMGTGPRHDHGEMKGNPPGAMNVGHRRCRQILRQSRQAIITRPVSVGAGGAR